MLLTRFRNATALAAGCLSMLATSQVVAQDDESYEIEEVVVTGTYLKGKSQFNSPSPIAVIGADNLNNIGASTVADLVQTLTINAGSQNNPDAFTQNNTTGTSNFNLRGLGVASTLVLLNGRRQVNTGALTNDGVTFVDTSSLVPQIAVQRIEIVKDGAAAIYGTDAVAGVVNFITDDNFEGLSLSARGATLTGEGSQSDLQVEGKFGWSSGNTNFMIAASYLDRTELTTAERRLSRPEDDSSALGNPGSFFVPSVAAGLAQQSAAAAAAGNATLAAQLAALARAPIIDPTGCGEVGGIPAAATTLPNGLQPGTCRFDFGDFFTLVPEEERIQLYGVVKHEFEGGHTFRAEVAYADNEASRGNSPSFPFLQLGAAQVPADHPNNVFGEQVTFFGRVSGVGGDVSPSSFTSETYRVSGAIDGPINDNWSYNLAATYAKNDHTNNTEDTVTDRVRLALQGLGGPNCDAATGTPGEGNCQYFNPFATSFTTSPNDPALLDHLIATQTIESNSELWTIDAVLSGTVGSLPAGDIGLAVGFQYRDETFGRDLDPLANADAFAFVIGAPDFEDSRSIYAFFAEALAPITDKIDLSVAARFEDYGGNIGSTFDPKVSLLARPTDSLTLRGSYSTSFRAPSQFQIQGQATSLNQISDPLTGGTFFAAVRGTDPQGGRALDPEQSKAWNFGLSWQPIDGLSVDIDYFNYDFSDVIIQENFQSVVNADPTGDRVVRAFDGGPILMVFVDYVNASSVKTDGLDVSVKYDIEVGDGVIQPFFDGTYLFSYDITDPQAGNIDGVGNRNFSNFGSPTPKTRFNTGIAFTNDTHDARFYVRHISGLDDDQVIGGVENGDIPSYTTVDVQYSLNLGGIFENLDGTSLQIGARNVFDKDVPRVATNGGFESRTHDPRQRSVYAKISTTF
ncbi:TonB-dependent receptor domain-containing protein [Kordiimonas laminariae]|uniref:TonB-dependent receptor domain-containing protein n=1 Tax=Kordiimonas laminariae TaxID=2917717 RepID=UPI001FF21196|nr:TonB-dependent receptor [Kordiimonas laminariae]MCK0069962.1 TonB-dependent receptor [Kordiimonas laminariae]